MSNGQIILQISYKLLIDVTRLRGNFLFLFSFNF